MWNDSITLNKENNDNNNTPSSLNFLSFLLYAFLSSILSSLSRLTLHYSIFFTLLSFIFFLINEYFLAPNKVYEFLASYPNAP
jgi:hypothetical protein